LEGGVSGVIWCFNCEDSQIRGDSDEAEHYFYIEYDNYTCDEYHLCENYSCHPKRYDHFYSRPCCHESRHDVVADATADASFGSERGQSIGAGEALEDGASGVV
jgi:hypothetical protein